MEPAEPVQMNIYQSNIHRKDLSWLYFDGDRKLQERQQGEDHVGRHVDSNVREIFNCVITAMYSAIITT